MHRQLVVPLAAVLMVVYSALYPGLVNGILLISFVTIQQRHVFAVALDSILLQQTIKAAVGFLVIAFSLFRILRLKVVGTGQPKWNDREKVLLFPCRTSHSRLLPRKHSFSYSYLTIGIPVDFEGDAGGLVSVGIRAKPGLSSWFSSVLPVSSAWFSIDPGDYLEREKSELGLRGKLDVYLRTQGADPAAYPYAYLVTAARFLGYHFNPVSFWYLYDADKCLSAMILEVNNTFDERRMYFLTPGDADNKQGGCPTSHQANETEDIQNHWKNSPSQANLTRSLSKDFHVSPFNSRKGSYTLTASDPLYPFMQGKGPLSNTISLISSKGRCKLVATLSQQGAALAPCDMTWYQKFRFLASWWWVGFLTFPRILKEAFSLFFRHKLHVWYRPEPLKTSIGRRADSTERQLERIFRRYLGHLVEQSAAPLAVKYIASGISQDSTQLMLSPAARDRAGTTEELEFKVLTPVFYTRLALGRASLVLELRNLGEYAYFKIIQSLRTRPTRIIRPLTSSRQVAEKAQTVDIRDCHMSSMDVYVLTQESAHIRAAYQSCVLKLFAADRISFGVVPLLEVQRLFLQACFAWFLSSKIGQLAMGLSTGGRIPSPGA
ncbi:hypothetical protein MMYC01_208085 [Madurella mycetomatis]|uniref:Uncharacterized protein n=1 Tax=Madurella mycetomatis TaxID=100816 RepID=A0A175VZP6_9PEZI|nr:hypothetical protein MMYC01_208085 [Madurella mycetomatis]